MGDIIKEMNTDSLFAMTDDTTPLELIYDANLSQMPAKDLGEAIIGMSICLKVAGRAMALDFEDVYIFPVEKGSVKTLLRYVKRNKHMLITLVSVEVVSYILISSLELIGTHGLSALKNPDSHIITTVDKKILELCMNGDYRKSIAKVARPINQENKKATIRVGKDSYEITCENQYKFVANDEEPILPELRNGDTVTLRGHLTRMNMEQNDMGFEYRGRKLSIFPIDPEKDVATEYHQFTPLPQVLINGIVVRDSDYVVPKIKVVKIDEFKEDQLDLFDNDASGSAITVTDYPEPK